MTKTDIPVISYRLIRSKRKTLAIQVRPGHEVLVRAPFLVSKSEIDHFVKSREEWIKKHLEKKVEEAPEYTAEEEKILRKKAENLLPGLVQKYADQLQVRLQKISINGARTRFGSCSMKGRLNFSFRLMDYPLSCIEYVALHEVAHLKHMNHSPTFYQTIASIMPDHRERAKLLKQKPQKMEV